MLPPACPEFLLAAAAVRRPALCEQIDAAFARPLNWDNLLPVIDKHRVAGLVLEGLQGHTQQLPAPVLAGLRMRSAKIALRSVATARAAYGLTQQLEERGIPAAVVKGPTLSVLAYGDVKLRHCRDIDLLVAPGDVVAAHAVLTLAGYRLHAGEAPSESAIQQYVRHSKHLAYVHGETGTIAELHGRLSDNPYLGQQRYPPETWQTVDVGFGIRLRTLCTEDLLLYLCAHGAGHGWFRLKWLADFAALLQRFPEASEVLLQRAGPLRLKRAVSQALTLSDRLFQTGKSPASLDWAEQRLVALGWDSMVRRNASTELYQEHFASTAIRLSQLLLSAHPGYLQKQVALEWHADENGPSRVTASKQRSLQRVARWVGNKLAPPGAM